MPMAATGTPDPQPAPPSADIGRQVHEALVTQLFVSTPQAVAGGMLFAAVAAWVVSHYSPIGLTLGWLALKLVLGAMRIAHTRRAIADPQRSRNLDRWLAQYMVLISVDAAAWSAMIPLFVQGASPLALGLGPSSGSSSPTSACITSSSRLGRW